jgi:hypothetical protein
MRKKYLGIVLALTLTLSLGSVLIGVPAPTVVYADCDRSGNNVLCDENPAPDNDGYNDTSGGLNVVVEAGTTVRDATSPNINLGDNNTVVNNGTIDTQFEGTNTNRDGISADDGNTITNNGTILTGGDYIPGNLAHDPRDPSGGGGSDGIFVENSNTVTNNGSIDTQGSGSIGIRLDGDDNTAVNNGTITGTNENAGIYAPSGSTGNTITNNGTITITGDSAAGVQINAGGNTVINNGTITVNSSDNSPAIGAQAGTTVVNNGTLNGDLRTGNGDDDITLGNGPVNGTIDGGSGSDSLTFAMSVPAGQIPALAAQIAALSSNTGTNTLTINGNPYTWVNIETLIDMLVAAAEETGIVTVAFTDGRLNLTDTAATAVVYCGPNNQGLDLYALTGSGVEFAFRVEVPAIQTALAAASSGNMTLVAPGRLGTEVWAVDGSNLLVTGPNGYIFPFSTNVCGISG